MGIWKEIRHALNNTLGTSNFKPLNTIVTTEITNSKEAILNQFYNNKSLLASDEVFYTFPTALSEYQTSGYPAGTTYEVDVCEFTTPLAGSLNLMCKAGVSIVNGESASSIAETEVIISKNGQRYDSFSTVMTLSGCNLKTIRLYGERNDVFKIKLVLKVSSASNRQCKAWLALYSLNATIKDSETISLRTLV